MSKFVGVVLEGVELAAGIVLFVMNPFVGALVLGAALISSGAGMVLSSIGTLVEGSGAQGGQQGAGFAFSSRNPIAAWPVAIGCCEASGKVVYLPK